MPQNNTAKESTLEQTGAKCNNKSKQHVETWEDVLGQQKERCYASLVRPIIEYACAVWDPYTQANNNKLEMLLDLCFRNTEKECQSIS